MHDCDSTDDIYYRSVPLLGVTLDMTKMLMALRGDRAEGLGVNLQGSTAFGITEIL
jgi:hypothetical protein